MCAIIDLFRPLCVFCGRIFTPYPTEGSDGNLTLEYRICMECKEEIQKVEKEQEYNMRPKLIYPFELES